MVDVARFELEEAGSKTAVVLRRRWSAAPRRRWQPPVAAAAPAHCGATPAAGLKAVAAAARKWRAARRSL